MRAVTIIVPTLNEEANIQPLLQRIEQLSIPDVKLKVLFVDDASTDGTIAAIRSWHDPSWVDVLQRTGKPDLARAVIEGVAHSQSDLVLVMDADLSHPVDRVPAMLAPLLDGTHDVTVGSRYVPGGGSDDWPIHRRLLSWGGGLLSRGLSDVKDATSGFFACRKECFERLDANAAGYKILLEVLVKGIDEYRVKEVPIRFTDRIHGTSKLSQRQMIEYLRRIVALSGGSASINTASKFALVGLSGVFVDFAVFLSLIHWGELAPESAHIFSFLAAFLSNYVLNSSWSFRYDHDHRRSWIIRGIKFLLIAILALALRGGVLLLFIDLLHWPPVLAIFPAIAAATLVNYLGSSYYVFAPTERKVSSAIRWRVIAIGCCAFILLLKLAYLGTAQLLPDEAYYWNYQQFLALSYIDHPPMIAWMIWLGTLVFGDNEFGVRIITFLFGLGTLGFIFALTRNIFGNTSAFIALLLASILPFTAALGGFLSTTDTPALFSWAGALYFAERALIARQIRAWWGLGLLFGIGLLSKYTIVLLALSLFVLMLIRRSPREYFVRFEPYFATLLAIVIALPVLIWNYQHDWISFGFQTTRRLSLEQPFSLHFLLLHALILLTPLGLWGLFKTIGTRYQSRCPSMPQPAPNPSDQTSLLWLSIIVPVGVFAIFAFQHYPRFHWTGPAWIGLLPLMAETLRTHSSSWFARWTRRSVLLFCILYGAIFHYVTLGIPYVPYGDFSDRYFWKDATQNTLKLVDEIEQSSGEKPVIIGLSKWSVASSLRFYAPAEFRSNILSRNAIGRSATMYEVWTQPLEWADRPILFIANDAEDLIETELTYYAAGLGEPTSKIIYDHAGAKLRELHYRTAQRYIPNPAKARH